MTDKKAMREAMKVAQNKGKSIKYSHRYSKSNDAISMSDLSQIDPAVLDYAATRLQAGFRGYMSRKY